RRSRRPHPRAHLHAAAGHAVAGGAARRRVPRDDQGSGPSLPARRAVRALATAAGTRRPTRRGGGGVPASRSQPDAAGGAGTRRRLRVVSVTLSAPGDTAAHWWRPTPRR